MRTYHQLILANRAWSQELTELDPDYFRRQIEGQKPDVLWIGCSDSRVSPEQITRTQPGELFIHRNIANLVHTTDDNFMSVLQFAVTVLKVGHIIVCGHYGCGGLHATLNGAPEGHIGDWLKNAADVHANHRHEIEAEPDAEAKLNRLVECNVRDQLLDLARTDIVQAAFGSGQRLHLHGWVYDLRDGLIKPLLDIEAETDLDALGPLDRVLSATSPAAA
ncbi:carbonic anhydrase [Sphingomonas sp. CJ99]